MTSQKIRMPHGVKVFGSRGDVICENINLEQFMNNTKNVKKIKLNYTVFGNNDKQQLKVYQFFLFSVLNVLAETHWWFFLCNPSDIDDLSRIRLSCSSGFLLELSYPVYR
jgi:hypothetical protein